MHQVRRNHAASAVSLPMYDLPELSTDHKILLQALSAQLRAQGSSSAADHLLAAATQQDSAKAISLDQGRTASELWDSPKLLLTQMCGLALHDRVLKQQPSPPSTVCLGVPIYSALGCSPGTYKAWVVVRTADACDGTYTRLSDLAGARVAVNHLDSYSGAVGLQAAIAMLEQAAKPPVLFFHPHAVLTGSHRASLAALRAGQADVASIDCITWALLERESPHELEPLRIIGATPSAPAPPIVTTAEVAASGTGDALRAALRITFGDGGASPTADAAALQAARSRLFIDGIRVDAAVTAPSSAFGSLRRLASRIQLSVAPAPPLAPSSERFWGLLDSSGYTFPVRCSSTAAQRWFDRGMLLMWGFNTEESASCFHRALEADPQCSMAHWGVSLAGGVNYNRPRLTRDEMRTASRHVEEARRLLPEPLRQPHAAASAAASREGTGSGHTYTSDGGVAWRDGAAREAALIHALQTRLLPLSACDVADTGPAGEGAHGGSGTLVDGEVHRALDTAYERAMRGVFMEAQAEAAAAVGGTPGASSMAAAAASQSFLEVAALFAEAVMTPRAWKLWPADVQASPAAAVVEARVALETALELPMGKRHPGVAHFYVHMMEAAPSEQVASAEVAVAALRSQWPATGHLLHMASHIDMHRGKYGLAIRSGQRAVEADRLYADGFGNDKYYTTYRNHHEHQLCWAAMFAGQHAIAAAAAERVVAGTPRSLSDKYVDILEPLGALPWEVDVRFGRWEELLRRPLPATPGCECVTTAFARYTRALAFSALGRLAEAESEASAFEAAVARVPTTRIVHMVTSHKSLAIASCVLRGEMAYRHCRFREAFDALRAAVALDDALPYDEPWGWKIPARHALGALLLERAMESSTGRPPTADAAALLAEAETVYRTDLQRYPENLWSLTGLKACLEQRSAATGDEQAPTRTTGGLRASRTELDRVGARLARALSQSDVVVRHSCFCAGRALERTGAADDEEESCGAKCAKQQRVLSDVPVR